MITITRTNKPVTNKIESNFSKNATKHTGNNGDKKEPKTLADIATASLMEKSK